MSDSYYIRIRGRVNGPYDQAKLMQLVQRGQLTKSHEVSLDGVVWAAAESITSIFGSRTKAQSAAAEKPATDVGHVAITRPPDGSRAEWNYAAEGDRKGPVTIDEMVFLISLGRIKGDTLVWKQGMVDWQQAVSVPEIARLIEDSDGQSKSVSQQGSTAQLSWRELFPVFAAFSDSSWSFAWVQCLALALLFPLFALEYHGKGAIDLTWASAIFSLYFSLLWTAFFHWCISPDKISPWRIIGVWLFTGTLGLLGVVIASLLVLPLVREGLAPSSEASFLRRVISWTFGIGVVEEVGKMLGLLVVAPRMTVQNPARSYCFLGVVSGLAFGTIEAIAYTHGYVAMHKGSSDPDGYGTLFFSLMLRWISLPLLHAVWAGIAGYFLGLGYSSRTSRWKWTFIGLAIAALLHGLYDVGAGDTVYSWLAVSSATISLLLLIGYLRTESQLVRRVRYNVGGTAASPFQ